MKTKTIVVDGVTYEAKEPSVGVIFPIMDLMSSDPKQFQMELIKRSVFVNGQALGEAVNDLTLGAYIKIGEAVIDIAGLAGDAEEGK